MINMMRPSMNDRSEESKPKPANQQAHESRAGAAAPQNQATKSGRLPLFRK
jgi:hypothetical protein